MSIIGQAMHGIYVIDAEYSVTIAVNHPKLVSAHAQISFLGGSGDYGVCGITQAVSASGVENFADPLGGIFRKNVSSMTFFAFAWESGMVASIVINFWS